MKSKPTPTLAQATDLIASECLATRTRLLNRTITCIYDDALRPHGLTVGQLNLLVVVAKLGPMTASDLARRLNMEKSTVSRTTHRMRKNDWLTTAVGSDDGQLLTLTELGESLVQESVPAWQDAQTQTTAVLGQRGAASIHAVGNTVWGHLRRK